VSPDENLPSIMPIEIKELTKGREGTIIEKTKLLSLELNEDNFKPICR
jgi:hypothetical protein